MAVEETAAELLAQVTEVLTFEGQSKAGLKSELPAQVLAEHAVNTRKTHKLMYSQLQVVKFLLDFLDSAQDASQDASQSALRKELAEAKQQWKALKAEYQRMVEAIKDNVPQMLSKLGEARKRAQLLEDALQRYQNKKLEVEEKARNAQSRCQKEQEVLRERQQQLEERVAELQGRLQAHREELQQLQGELRVQELQADEWREKMRTISDFRHLLETLQGVKLISASERDLVIELVSHAQPVVSAPHHLELRLHWDDDGNVVLQSGSPLFPLSAVLPMGSCSTIKGVILELQHSYFQQVHLLAEIESLQSCFAIDWQQEKRLLSYLKPTSTCSLYVEPGYPLDGQICLQAVKSHGGMVDVSCYKPPQERPSLKDWLEYLHAVDFGAPLVV